MGENQAPQLHDWRIVRENLHADGLLQVQRCHRCNAARTIWTPQDGPPQVQTTHPAQLQPDCPPAPRQRRPQTTTTAERSGAMQAQAPPWSGPSWPTQLERKLDRLILLFVLGLVVAVLLMLTRAAYAARRIATQKTMATALFHIDAAVAVEAVAREIRYDAGAQAAQAVRTRAAAFATRDAVFATTDAARAAYETAGATIEAAYTNFESAADLYAADLDSAPAAATYAAALATLEAVKTPDYAALATYEAALATYEATLFENTIPAATIEAAAQATLRRAYQDHQEAAALATAAVTYEAQAAATIEAQEALPLWYWLLPQR